MIHIIPYKALSRCGIEELAAQQQMNERRRMTGGVMFARKEDTSQKDEARNAILALLTKEVMPGRLSVLTLPGLHWSFETRLMKQRDPYWRCQQDISNTRFTCVENDRFVYYSSATKMPGNRGTVVRSLERPRYAELSMGNGIVDRYVFANVDDLMQDRAECFDVAWLDYTGPLSVARMKIIERFWRDQVSKVLIVASLKARWNKETSRAIDRHGSCAEWIKARLPGEVLHEMEYFDSSPMVQVAISKGAA